MGKSRATQEDTEFGALVPMRQGKWCPLFEGMTGNPKNLLMLGLQVLPAAGNDSARLQHVSHIVGVTSRL